MGCRGYPLTSALVELRGPRLAFQPFTGRFALVVILPGPAGRCACRVRPVGLVIRRLLPHQLRGEVFPLRYRSLCRLSLFFFDPRPFTLPLREVVGLGGA